MNNSDNNRPVGPDGGGCSEGNVGRRQGNICDFGAVGDGQSHPLSEQFSDLARARQVYPHARRLDDEHDWAAIQAAAVEGNIISIPPGEYILGINSIDLDGKKQLVGFGSSVSRLYYTGEDAAIRVNTGKEITTADWLIRDLAVDCANEGQHGIRLGQGCVSPKSANNGALERLTLTGATVAGLVLDHSQINVIRKVRFSSNPGNGCCVEGGGNTDTHFHGCSFRNNGRRGLSADGGSVLSFYGCTFEENKLEGVYLVKRDAAVPARNWVFERCYFEQNNIAQDSGDYGQLCIDSTVNQSWQHVEVRRCYFTEAGTGNWNVKADKCQLVIWYPETNGSTPIGKDGGSSAAVVTIWDDSGPNQTNLGGWVLGGPNARVVYHKVNRAGEEEVYFNKAGSWKRALRLSATGVETDDDIEVTESLRGIILKSPGGTRFRIIVDDAGNLQTGLVKTD